MNKLKNKKFKFFSFVFCLMVIFINSTTYIFASANTDNTEHNKVKGLWISFLDLEPIICQKTEKEFSDNFDEMMENAKSLNITDVFVHVRPFSDALYNSKIFPTSHLLTGKQGDILSFDPLEIMIQKAHEKGLKIHAWINPYRIQNVDKIELADNHPAKKWVDGNDTSRIVKMPNGSIHFNPSSIDAMELVVSGVDEIVQKYKVDGIHLDDYFYPTTEKWIDKDAYDIYVSGGGELSLEDWRMNNVDILVRSIYSAIKAAGQSVEFGISPAGNLDSNYKSHFADVKKWCSNPGYLDYICPQIYWGFKHKVCPFKETLNAWEEIIKRNDIKLYVGLAFYRIGTIDNWAGEAGRNEWVDDKQVIQEQVKWCEADKRCDGFVFFRYDHMFKPEPDKKSLVDEVISDLK